MTFAVSSEQVLVLDFNMIRLISVVVPVYNVEDVLHFCIDSILNQTYSDFELLLVDDGSTDKSGDICDQYARKDTRIRVFHKENGGVSSARNLGIDNANGEYICFIDSDDYVNSEFLDSLISHCLQNKQSVKFSINSAFFIEMCYNKCKKIIKSNKKACT